MTGIDLSVPRPRTGGTVENLPRRIALTLPELQLLAEYANHAPLPFDLVEEESEADSTLASRLGRSPRGPGDAEDTAYAEALAGLHDPAETLTRRGLLDGETADAAIAGALGLLASPHLALDLDVSVDGVRAKAWHRCSGDAVATLATVDGVVFELSWFGTDQWPAELGRVAVLGEDVEVSDSAVPAALDLPYELLHASTEALASGRSDLIGVLVDRHADDVRDADGDPVPTARVTAAMTALGTEARGRLRALVADVSQPGAPTVGVVSWVLVADGWRSLRAAGETDVQVRAVRPHALAAALAPVISQVIR